MTNRSTSAATTTNRALTGALDSVASYGSSLACILLGAPKMHRDAAADSTHFYRVGLACEAAPDIGCGIRAKPVLQSLERSERVAGAWLIRSGAVLAVRWKSATQENEGVVASAFTGEDCACIEEISDAGERRSLYESLAVGRGWYRAADIDLLSVEEAALIAERVVGRMAVKAALDAEQSARLAKSIAHACERILTTEAPGTAESRDERLRRAILDAGCAQLRGDHYGVLEQAIAVSGHAPTPTR
jgi:hypothetical protein